MKTNELFRGDFGNAPEKEYFLIKKKHNRPRYDVFIKIIIFRELPFCSMATFFAFTLTDR